MIYLFALTYGCLWAFLRRLYGGSWENTPILKERGVQTVLMVVSMLAVCFPYDSLNWWTFGGYCVLVAWVMIRFWSNGIGSCRDIGRGGYPTEEMIERYGEDWYDKICKKLIPEKDWYSIRYDYMFSMLRYTTPMIAVCWLSPYLLIAGLLITPVYNVSWCLSDKNIKVFNQTGTELAEYLAGFVFGYCWFMAFLGG